MTAALLRCPFCGDRSLDIVKGTPVTVVRCVNCLAQGPWGRDAERAANCWNLRYGFRLRLASALLLLGLGTLLGFFLSN